MTDKAKTDVVDPAIADPAFSGAPGQVLGPIKSGLAGYAVVEVVKITPAVTPTLEQLRPQLETAAKTKAARDRAYAAVTKYNDAHNAGANLADAARAAGVTPAEFGPITAEGHDLQNQPVAAATPKLLKEAFSLAQGAESELEDEGGGEYFAVRVEKVAPPALPQVAEIRPLLIRAYMQQAVLERLNAKAADLVQAIHKGQSLEAVASSASVPTKSLPNVSRQGLEQSKQLDPRVINDLFAAKKGDLVSGQVGAVQVIVARIDGIQPAGGDNAARETVAAAAQFNQLLLQDMIAAARTRAVSVVKPEGDLTAARLALGIAADQTSQSSASPKRGPAL
jgi:peptidyl-prolyl cis-trans isomerase D